MKEYYKILGVHENATDEEITASYHQLKEKYGEERWLDGEAGNEAARMLTKVETAYKEIMACRKETKKNTEGQNSYEKISELLKQDRISEAQACLDDFNERGAEWHYLQAVVYYKKNWTNDSKKQLEIAMQMDPNNQWAETLVATVFPVATPTFVSTVCLVFVAVAIKVFWVRNEKTFRL